MEPPLPPDPEPFLTPESRVERGVRRSQARRRTLIALVVAVVVLGGAAYGIYALAAHGSSDATGVTLTSVATGTSSTLDTAPVTTSPPGTSSSTTPTTTAPPSTTVVPNLPAQKLAVTANPQYVKLAITLQDGTTLSGKTPFSQAVPGGNVRIDFSKDGYNTATRRVALAEPTDLKIWLDPAGQLYQSLVRFKCGPSPKQVAFTPDGKEMWVSLLGGFGVEIFEPTTGKKLGGVKLGQYGAVEVIFSRDGSKVYASQMETASVYEIDRATRKVTRQFKTGGTWTKVLLLSPDESKLYASNWVSNDVSEIDLVTGKLLRVIKTVTTPRGLYVTPDGRKLYVAGYENGDIQKIDLSTGTKRILLKTGGAMRHMVADDTRERLYVDDMSTNEVYVIDLATDKATKLCDTDQRPNTMELSPDGKVLYVSNRGKDNPKTYYIPGPEWGTILAIDTATGKVLDAIVGGNQCTGLDVSPDGTLLAFSDFLDDHIRVYTIPAYETLVAGNGGRAEARFRDMVKH